MVWKLTVAQKWSFRFEFLSPFLPRGMNSELRRKLVINWGSKIQLKDRTESQFHLTVGCIAFGAFGVSWAVSWPRFSLLANIELNIFNRTLCRTVHVKIKMLLAHIFLPAMLLVICKSQQTSIHLPSAYGNEETPNYLASGLPSLGADAFAPNAIGNDLLLDRYREIIANSLLKLYDSCKVHDFLQNIRRNMENDNGECVSCEHEMRVCVCATASECEYSRDFQCCCLQNCRWWNVKIVKQSWQQWRAAALHQCHHPFAGKAERRRCHAISAHGLVRIEPEIGALLLRVDIDAAARSTIWRITQLFAVREMLSRRWEFLRHNDMWSTGNVGQTEHNQKSEIPFVGRKTERRRWKCCIEWWPHAIQCWTQ